MKILKKITDLLPVSRKRYFKAISAVNETLTGFMEAEANHSQIQASILQQLQYMSNKLNEDTNNNIGANEIATSGKKRSTKNGSDVAFQ